MTDKRSMSDKMRDAYLGHAGAGWEEPKKTTRAFASAGYEAPEPLEEEIADVVEVLKAEASHVGEWLDEALEEVAAIMRERGAKYGPGNISEFGELGVLVRLSDKLARLRYASGKDFADEAARDAWLDVIGYGLIGLAWADGHWPGSEKA